MLKPNSQRALRKIRDFKNCSSGIWGWTFFKYLIKVLELFLRLIKKCLIKKTLCIRYIWLIYTLKKLWKIENWLKYAINLYLAELVLLKLHGRVSAIIYLYFYYLKQIIYIFIFIIFVNSFLTSRGIYKGSCKTIYKVSIWSIFCGFPWKRESAVI